MAEGARLESVFTRKGNVGSNPTLSAIKSELQRIPAYIFPQYGRNMSVFRDSSPTNRTAENGLLTSERGH